jgi:hypothetical protein
LGDHDASPLPTTGNPSKDDEGEEEEEGEEEG